MNLYASSALVAYIEINRKLFDAVFNKTEVIK